MIKTVSVDTLIDLCRQASQAERGRAHLNLHDSLDAPVQRLFIAMQPDTYIRPHRHPQPNKWEFFLLLEGEIDVLIFNDTGKIHQRIELSASQTRAVEIPPGTWHSYVSRTPGSLVLEVKEGPFIPTPEEDFAPWAPAEQTSTAVEYLAWLRQAQPE